MLVCFPRLDKAWNGCSLMRSSQSQKMRLSSVLAHLLKFFSPVDPYEETSPDFLNLSGYRERLSTGESGLKS